MKCAAFFDFDKTLIPRDSQHVEALSLLHQPFTGIPFFFRLLRVAIAGKIYKKNLISHDKYNGIYLNCYKNIELSELTAHAKDLYAKTIKPSLIPAITEILDNHRKNGDLIIILSATSNHLIEPFINEINPDAWKATQIETDNKGICTGKPKGKICVAEEKAKALVKIALQLDIDLSKSTAYSDHHADLRFLESVGYPKVVNPTHQLSALALKRGWPVVK